MDVKVMQCFILLQALLSSGLFAKEAFHLKLSKPFKNNETPVHKGEARRLLFPPSEAESESLDTMPQLDVITPMATVPTINPSTPATNTYTTPTTTPTNPVTGPYTTPSSSSGQSWCVASQSASQTALQVALDYACGYGGGDCSAIQQGGICFNPNTVRDHASYAFNSYYRKNPVPTSCDFGGTAVITNTDPSTSTCLYPSSSISSSILNTTNPTGSTVFGSTPPGYGGTSSESISMLPPPFTLIILFPSLVYLKMYE